MEISPHQPVLGNEKLVSTSNIKKPIEGDNQNISPQPDIVEISEEAVAAAESDSGVATPYHGGGGIHIPD